MSSLLLVACASGCGKDDETPPTESNTTADRSAEIALYEEKLAYYREVIEGMESEMLSLKESNYITVSEYKIRIENLENQIDALSASKGDGSVSAGKNDDAMQDPPAQTPVVNPDSIVSNEEDPAAVFTYSDSDGGLIITGYMGSAEKIEVPSSIDGKAVVGIGESAFANLRAEEIILPAGIVSIDWFAFSGCFALKSVTIPASVRSVGYGAFDNCPSSLVIRGGKGTYIEAFAASWGMTFVGE